MRITFVMAVALIAAGPGYAQNTTADANSIGVIDNTAVDANAVVAADNMAVDMNMPADVPVTEETAPAPALRDKGDFPWGVLGLIGLVGLLGRKR